MLEVTTLYIITGCESYSEVLVWTNCKLFEILKEEGETVLKDNPVSTVGTLLEHLCRWSIFILT